MGNLVVNYLNNRQ